MRKLFFIAMITLLGNAAIAQSNKGMCKVEVNDISKVTGFGYLAGYSVEFKNNSKKTVDGIYWNVYYYNNANDLLFEDKSSFNSTSTIDPIAMGFTKTLVRSQSVKGASKVFIKITKVHFSDGTTCK
jgi:hypothetical protein